MIKVPDKKITIIGAGMGGSLLAIYLARRHFDVEVYESRGCIEDLPVVSYKSINQSLCVRGIRALQEVRLWDDVKKMATRETGRVIHQQDRLLYQPYGERQGFAEWSINRNDLNKSLIAAMKQYPITVTYHERCVAIDFEEKTVTLENQQTKERTTKPFQVLIGADGIHSMVRKMMEEAGHTSARLDVMDWGYKNINVPAPEKGELPFRKDAFHLWSKKSAAVFGIPNWRGFFTSTITLPLSGDDSFESIREKDECADFFKRHVPDLYPYLESYVSDFLKQPATPFTSLFTSKWHYRDRCLLMGDAAHAATIFYGQGINAAFEDCRIFAECLDRYFPDMETVFQIFEARRKPDTDALARICKARFTDLKDKYESPLFVARSHVEMWLEQLFPNQFHSLYTLMVHTTLSYSSVRARYAHERRIARLFGMDVGVITLAIASIIRKSYNSVRQGMTLRQ